MDPLSPTDFPTARPLPPIGVPLESQENEKKSSDTEKSDRSRKSEDKNSNSNASTTGFDREGEASARPRVVRGFRPEPISDDDLDEDTPRTMMEQTKRKTYDGREIVFVTLETQTDWDWVETAEQTGTARTLAGSDVGDKDEKEKPVSPKSGSSRPEIQEDKGPGDQYQYQMPYSDEYGIPILDLSSDTDDESEECEHFEEKLRDHVDDVSSDDEVTHKKIKDERKFIPSVGPPNILQHTGKEAPEIAQLKNESVEPKKQSSKKSPDLVEQKNKSVDPKKYQRESEKHEINAETPEARKDEDDYDKDEQGNVQGMFSGKCEFCQKAIKPFPTLDQQMQFPPESLYCCSDYREFVEFVLSTTKEMEEEVKRKNKIISVKPHEHVGSKQERNAAKEKAVQRMRERELQRRQQEASGIQQNFFASGSGGTSKAAFPKVHSGGLNMKDLYGTPEAKAGKGSAHDVLGGASGVARVNGIAGVKVPGAMVPGVQNPRGAAATLFTSDAQSIVIPPNVARQMKTINYQLSSQKCLEEGWTLRAPSPLTDDLGDDVFIPEPLNPDMISEGRDRPLACRPDSAALLKLLRERPLIEKFYETGQKFLTMFPDGTGNVFYPSGNLAILISSVKLGQYFYTIHQDMKRSGVIAGFEPNGYGFCYFPNGEIRLYIDQYGGIELDNVGGKKRKWSWKDQIIHVHAPPFQPICIGLNRNMGVRVMSQENISLTFSSNQRSCRFNMGARLKVVAPENAPLKEIEENHIYLEEKKTQVDAILDKVTNLLKFPNHPKLNKMLPPLHISAKQTKTEKMKKERQIFLAQQSARDKKQAPVSVN